MIHCPHMVTDPNTAFTKADLNKALLAMRKFQATSREADEVFLERIQAYSWWLQPKAMHVKRRRCFYQGR